MTYLASNRLASQKNDYRKCSDKYWLSEIGRGKVRGGRLYSPRFSKRSSYGSNKMRSSDRLQPLIGCLRFLK
jgi:hypothetical protein